MSSGSSPSIKTLLVISTGSVVSYVSFMEPSDSSSKAGDFRDGTVFSASSLIAVGAILFGRGETDRVVCGSPFRFRCVATGTIFVLVWCRPRKTTILLPRPIGQKRSPRR